MRTTEPGLVAVAASAEKSVGDAQDVADEDGSQPTGCSRFESHSDPQRRNVANAPTHLASVKGAVPIIGHGLTAATRLSLEGPRWDRFEDVGDAPQEQTDAAVVWDIVLSGRELRWGLSYALGVYNAFDWRYSLPVSDELRQRTIDQAGRTLLASAELAF